MTLNEKLVLNNMEILMKGELIMSDMAITIVLILFPVTFFILKPKHEADVKYLVKFNEQYHIDNALNDYAKDFLKIGKFPYAAFKEEDVDKGIQMDMDYLRKQDDYLDTLSVEQHGQLIRGLDTYLMGDVSSVKKAKRIAKERGYKF